MKVRPVPAEELKTMMQGEQFWWVCPPLKKQGIPARVEGPMTFIRFSKKDMGGWTEEIVEYRHPDGNVYYHFVLSLTSGNWPVFKTAEEAQAYLADRWP